jgi:hypothetical protein
MIVNFIKSFFVYSTTAELIGQIIGFAALFVAIFVFLLKKRTHIIAAKLATDALYGIHFFLLGQSGAAMINVINSVRGIVFYNKGRKWASSNLWCVAFVLLTLSTTFLNSKSGFSPIMLMPAVGSSLAVIGLWSSNTLILRIFNLIGISLWFIYAIIISSPSAAICNAIYIISLLITITRELIAKFGKEKNSTQE